MAKNERSEGAERQWLAGLLSFTAILGITAISVTTILVAKDGYEAAKYVMVAVVPILASWVATVLAYYFAKENLAAATQSVSNLSQQSRADRLPLTPVTDKMIGFDHIVKATTDLTKDDAKLSALASYFTQKGVGRLPIFDDKGIVQILIDRGTVDRYIRERVAGGSSLDTLTYGGFVNDASYQADLHLFAFVSQTSTLADAKRKMTSIDHCNDVFVTTSGGAAEAVVGWVTDNAILEAERV